MGLLLLGPVEQPVRRSLLDQLCADQLHEEGGPVVGIREPRQGGLGHPSIRGVPVRVDVELDQEQPRRAGHAEHRRAVGPVVSDSRPSHALASRMLARCRLPISRSSRYVAPSRPEPRALAADDAVPLDIDEHRMRPLTFAAGLLPGLAIDGTMGVTACDGPARYARG